jgi:LysM repeat protein
MRSCPVRPLRILAGLALLGLFFLGAPFAVAHAGGEPTAQGQSSGCSGYYYTVRRGDTWSIISRRVAISVANLKAANPQAIRPRDLIYAGENICIPSASQGGVESGGYWYQVKPGDTWNIISRATGVSVRQLWEANPGLLNRRQWLYIGQRVWIPQGTKVTATAPSAPGAMATTELTPAATPAAIMPTAGVPVTAEAVVTATVETATAAPAATLPPTATPVPTAAATATPVPTAAATATPVPTAAATATSVPTAAAMATSVPTAAAMATVGATAVPAATTAPTAVALPPKPADCPKTLADYDEAVVRFLNNPANNVTLLNRSLTLCRVADPDKPGAVSAAITGAQSQDVVVIVNDEAAEGPAAGGALLVFHRGQQGYVLAHKRAGQGRIELIATEDLNEDGKFDIAYSDRSCGAHTCFGALFVDSWDGEVYTDWIEDEPTIAEPEYSVKDVTRDGQGKEIIVHGGVIGSVGAGPQRAWTETYISPAGAAYRLLSQVYDPSACLYHKVVDANRAFDSWALDGFEPAIEAYKAALAERNPQACGNIRDEVKTLQDFARFRLVVADVAAGEAAEATRVAPQITHPGLKKAVTAFLTSYAANTSVIQACRDVTKLAATDATTWQFLADWGYANPSFTAQELCPLN